MTFSIVSSIKNTGELCVATATCYVAVGSRVPKISPGIGAIAVQATPNPCNRKKILDLIKKGESNKDAIEKILKEDKKKEERQIVVINSKCQSYIFTGKKTISISDSLIGDDFAIAGNMLGSNSVVSSMAKAYENNSKSFLPKRLLYALKAGEEKGGDKRGRMSAAIIYSKPTLKTIVLRIDFSNDPLKDLFKAIELRFSKNYLDISDH